MCFFFSSRRRHTRCALVTGVQTCALPISLGPQAQIMVDANQAWEPAIAGRRIAALERYQPFWIEEPLAADEPLQAWRALADSTPIALAAGENIRGQADFEAAAANGHLRFIQPDVAKWGGISGCLAVARHAEQAGLVFCPHWLGGGIGLAASVHLSGALGPVGLVETWRAWCGERVCEYVWISGEWATLKKQKT